jgi:hypothetical protein
VSIHLQLYPPKVLDWTIVLLALFVPATLTAYLMHSLTWFVGIPFGIIVFMLFIAALPIKRHVTAEQFADELERHLLGTEGPRDWDDTISVRIADPRLEAVRMRLGSNLDSLSHEKDKDELRSRIAALRRGELPEVTLRPERRSLFRWRK